MLRMPGDPKYVYFCPNCVRLLTIPQIFRGYCKTCHRDFPICLMDIACEELNELNKRTEAV